jgi:hypothetical protein
MMKFLVKPNIYIDPIHMVANVLHLKLLKLKAILTFYMKFQSTITFYEVKSHIEKFSSLKFLSLKSISENKYNSNATHKKGYFFYFIP